MTNDLFPTSDRDQSFKLQRQALFNPAPCLINLISSLKVMGDQLLSNFHLLHLNPPLPHKDSLFVYGLNIRTRQPQKVLALNMRWPLKANKTRMQRRLRYSPSLRILLAAGRIQN